MTLKNKIEKEIKDYSKHHFLEAGSSEDIIFKKGCVCGVEIAIKAVIGMLEERRDEHIGFHEWELSDEDEIIINLLKSKA